jgi:hypothetical protein
MIMRIIDAIIGVKLKRENFNHDRKRIISCIAVIIISYLILVSLFPIIDSLIKSSEQPWYAVILTKYSFVAVSIRIIFLSLFTNLNNPMGRFKAAFSLQLIGFIGSVVIHSLLSGFIDPSQSIDPIIKSIYGLLPFAVNIVVFVAVRQVYNIRHFNEDEFFQNKPNN